LKNSESKYSIIDSTTNQLVSEGKQKDWIERKVDDYIRNINIIDTMSISSTNGYLIYLSNDKEDIMAKKFIWNTTSEKMTTFGSELYLRTNTQNEKQFISLISLHELRNTWPFDQLNGSTISAGFI